MLKYRNFVAKRQDLYQNELSYVKHLHITLCFD
ncbi:waaS, partial [Escherichia coli]|nr:waaS [Escherichia coli]